MKFYTYAHRKNSNGDIFYIGKGVASRHKSLKSRSKFWFNIVNKHGYAPEILAYWESNEEASKHEQFLISTLRKMGISLCNMTDGGEGRRGVTNTPEIRAIHSKRMQNPEFNPSKRADVREKLKGPNNPMFGRRGKNNPNYGRSREDQRVIITCPKCTKSGKAAGMRRWHFDHCKIGGTA